MLKLDREAFYSERHLVDVVGISPGSLAKGRAEQGLRSVRRGHCRFYRGDALIAWLSGESHSGGVELAEPAGVAP